MNYLIGIGFVCVFVKVALAFRDKPRRLWHVATGCALLLVVIVFMGERL